MKIITETTDIKDIFDIFPGLLEYKNSNKVKICGHRPVFGAEFVYYNYNIIVLSFFGDYAEKNLNDIILLANIKPKKQIIVPSTIKQPIDLPDNVHWLTFRSMYAVYAKNNKYITRDRPAIKKQFVSMNHRFTWFRQELLYYLYANNLLDNSYFSYCADDRLKIGSRESFNQGNEIIGADRYPTVNRDTVYNMLPYKNFVEKNKVVRIPEDVMDWTEIQELYNTSAVGIESETYMEEYLDYNPGLTEKTIRPLILGNPFLVYSNRGTLKTLQEMGFKTFGNIVDESYDNIHNPQQRWEAILVQIGKLAKQDPTILMDSVNEIVTHNQDHILTTVVKQLEDDDQQLNNLIRSLL